MQVLVDTHLLLSAAQGLESLPEAARPLMAAPETELIFSVASVWEVAIKAGLGRPDFRVDPRLLRRGLVDNGYRELPITGQHAAAISNLPPIHKDPFDRLLVAQARVEGVVLLTSDSQVADYGSPVRLV